MLLKETYFQPLDFTRPTAEFDKSCLFYHETHERHEKTVGVNCVYFVTGGIRAESSGRSSLQRRSRLEFSGWFYWLPSKLIDRLKSERSTVPFGLMSPAFWKLPLERIAVNRGMAPKLTVPSKWTFVWGTQSTFHHILCRQLYQVVLKAPLTIILGAFCCLKASGSSKLNWLIAIYVGCWHYGSNWISS